MVPALPGSIVAVLHETVPGIYVLPLQGLLANVLEEKRLERAIGVLYLPATERQSHYFLASVPGQFDAVLHIDHGSAVTPLESRERPAGEAPETYPAGV